MAASTKTPVLHQTSSRDREVEIRVLTHVGNQSMKQTRPKKSQSIIFAPELLGSKRPLVAPDGTVLEDASRKKKKNC